MKLEVKTGDCSKDQTFIINSLPEQLPDEQHSVNGIAALGICESLLLALIDLKLLSEAAAHNLLSDVITTHTWAAEISAETAPHQAAAHQTAAEAARGVLKRVIVSNVIE